MDTVRLTALRDHLAHKVSDAQFDMMTWGRPFEMNHCGTAGCIAGWACALFSPETPKAAVPRTAYDLLDLTERQAHELFMPAHLSNITRQDAVDTLTRLIETGEVRWTYSV